MQSRPHRIQGFNARLGIVTSVTMPGGAVRRFTYATLESSLVQ